MNELKLRKLRKIKDIINYLKEKNINITSYKLRKLFLGGNISGIRLDNNFYFYLDEIDRYFNLWVTDKLNMIKTKNHTYN